jgi:hypothetical protein
MAKMNWPANLSLWKSEIAKAARDAKNQASFHMAVSFQAPAPRASVDDPPHDIHLGAQVLLENPPIATYSLMIGQKHEASKPRVLRRMHFDLQEEPDTHEPKPILHLHVAGPSLPALARAGYDDAAFEHLLPWLEKPRIPCLPQSFALLAHFALLEYHSTDQRLAAFVSSPSWLTVVTEAESEVLKPFFSHGNCWLTSARRKAASLLSVFYGFPAD